MADGNRAVADLNLHAANHIFDSRIKLEFSLRDTDPPARAVKTGPGTVKPVLFTILPVESDKG